ncbi:MAG TPA: molybdenum cofactor guanylyltransferase [Syntrophomonadaceae bacterium]|nr:molybdenum cofactor guanylyltransferase [Syntrophomonadaceae bacterium]
MKVTGAILAGGKSTRMKYNKSFAKIGEKNIIEIILAKFEDMFDDIIIITNEPKEYEFLGKPMYRDIFVGLGPISGIHSALINSTNDVTFVLACDMPFVPENLIEYMLNKIEGYDTVVARTNNFFQATSAVYHQSSLPVLTNCLENNKLKTTLIFREMKAKILDEPELMGFGNLDEIFLNINDEFALSNARKIARRFFE